MTNKFFSYTLSPIALVLLIAVNAPAVHANVSLPAIFSDNMVLQRNAKTPVWGTADSGEKVTVAVAGKSLSTVAAKDGSWRVVFPSLPVGDNYSLTATGSNPPAGSDRVTVNNVAVGEVWLASGQSNMAYALNWDTTYNGPDIASSTDPDLRLFHIVENSSLSPLSSCPGSWLVSNPQNAPGFSAAAYYFARNLRAALKVPVGIVQSDFGGTRIEEWISYPALMSDPLVRDSAKADLLAMQQQPTRESQFPIDMDAWLTTNSAHDAGNAGETAGWQKPDFDDSGWKTTTLPVTFSGLGMQAGGVVWYRKTVTFPVDAAADNLNFTLGYQNSIFNVYLNGVELKTNGAPKPFYPWPVSLDVPRSLIKPGQPNVVAIREYGLTQNSGLYVGSRDMGLPTGSATADDNWRYMVEQPFPALSTSAGNPPTAPIATMTNTPSTLFNAMINPVAGYGMKGCIWYQGESNAGNYGQYLDLLTDMIGDWRSQWNEGDFPFIIEQLANYGWPATSPSFSSVAGVREAQMQASTTVPNTGLAVAIDIGEVSVHPKNKREVGRRLAQVALSSVYRDWVVGEGPIYSTMKIDGDHIVVSFKHSDDGLIARGGDLKQFAIAGEDKKFVWANALIDGDTVLVSNPHVPNPVAVRYAFADNPQGCNLYNGAGLPASPFRTDTWGP